MLLVLALARVGMEQVGRAPSSLPDGNSNLDALLEQSRDDQEDRTVRSTPLGPGEKLDPNLSAEEQLDRLPGIGPSTARAVVAYRQEEGGFSTAEDLLRVPGIGPSKLERIAPYLDFSKGMPLELRRSASSRRLSASASSATRVVSEAEVGQMPENRVDLNRATAPELEALPGIGPALAKRVVESRRRDGPFSGPEDLLRVPGIGPATLARIRSLVLPGG